MKPQDLTSRSMSTLQHLEETVRKVTGQSAEVLRHQTLSELRHATETRTKKPLTFYSRFPLIGRGNVMRDRVVDHKTVECMLDKSLR